MTTHRASAHAPVLGGVPRLDSGFTGRETLLEQIHEGLGSHAGARYLIGGGSGVGKSWIAAEYARRFGHHYDLIWWVPASTDIESYRAYLRMAEHLDLPVSYEHVPRTVQSVRRALAHDPGVGRWLLVFDDAVDVEALATEYFPIGGQGRVLITTRDHRWIPRHPSNGQVVPRLTTAESLSLLRRVCPDRLDPSQAGERLAEHLEHLPLALAQVGAFLRDSALTTDEFFELFTERHADLMSHMGTEDDHTAPLAAAWSIQAEELGRATTDQSRETEHMVLELVQLSAFLAPGPLSRSLFSRSWEPDTGSDRRQLPGDDERLDKVLAYMSEHHLASHDDESGTFQPHALLRAVIRNSLSLEERLRYRGLAQTVLARTDPRAPTDPAHRTDYLQLYGHVKAANAWSSRDPAVRDLVLNVIDFLTEVGHYQDAISLSDQAVNAWHGDESRLLHARLRRSKIRRIHGEYGTALEEARDIHRGQIEREGAENDDALEAHRAVAIALSGLARFHESERIFQQILEYRRARYPASDHRTLEAAHDYGRVLQEQSRFAESLAVDERNLRERAALLGENDVQTLRTGLTLGLNLLFLGRLEEARDRIQHCMEGFASVSADDGPHALQGLLFLSVIHRRLGEPETALDYSTRALLLYGRRHPPTVRQMLYCRVVHMVTLSACGQREEALREAEQLLPPLDERYPVDHPFRATARASIAIVLRAAGRYTEAVRLDQEALERLHGIYGPGSFSAFPTALNLATDLYLLHRTEQALDLDLLTEAACRERLPDNHPVLLNARRNLLVSRHALGENVDEEWSRLRAVYTTRFGPDHPSVTAMAAYTRQDCDVLSFAAL